MRADVPGDDANNERTCANACFVRDFNKERSYDTKRYIGCDKACRHVKRRRRDDQIRQQPNLTTKSDNTYNKWYWRDRDGEKMRTLTNLRMLITTPYS
jgi:hypothetical protein